MRISREDRKESCVALTAPDLDLKLLTQLLNTEETDVVVGDSYINLYNNRWFYIEAIDNELGECWGRTVDEGGNCIYDSYILSYFKKYFVSEKVYRKYAATKPLL